MCASATTYSVIILLHPKVEAKPELDRALRAATGAEKGCRRYQKLVSFLMNNKTPWAVREIKGVAAFCAHKIATGNKTHYQVIRLFAGQMQKHGHHKEHSKVPISSFAVL